MLYMYNLKKMSYSLKELAENRERNKKDIPILKINDNGKSNISELIKKEKKFKVNIDEIKKEVEFSQNFKITLVNEKPEVWECQRCTFVNINGESNCIMCNTPSSIYNMSYLVNNFFEEGYLYGNDDKITKCSNISLEMNNLLGMYFQQDSAFPIAKNIVKLLKNYGGNSSNIIVIINNNGELTGYLLNSKLIQWIDYLTEEQEKDSHIVLSRNINIYEKGKMTESNEIDLELFCYPTAICNQD